MAFPFAVAQDAKNDDRNIEEQKRITEKPPKFKTMQKRKKNNQPVKEKPIASHPSGKKETSFFEVVYEIVRQIPKGRVSTYGAIAACAGTGLSARMVGWAMNGAHHPQYKVPAHRVVNRAGMLTGKHHFSTPDEMQRLLEKEKVKVTNDQVQDFNKIFWDPSKELI